MHYANNKSTLCVVEKETMHYANNKSTLCVVEKETMHYANNKSTLCVVLCGVGLYYHISFHPNLYVSGWLKYTRLMNI